MKRNKFISIGFLLLCLLFASGTTTMAASISYTATDLSLETEGLWQIDYHVSDFNTGAYQGFQIIFGHNLYKDIVLEYSDDNWDAFATQPNVIFGLEEPGMIDALALVSGSVLTGDFSARFSWLGEDAPGSQQFFLYNDVFQTVLSGTTTPVPVPGTLGLLFLGLAGIWAKKSLTVKGTRS